MPPLPGLVMRHGLDHRSRLAASLSVLSGLLVLSALLATGPTPILGADETEPIRVVATTTVLADLAVQAGGAAVAVSSLVPKGGEVHTFDPSPADAARLAEADLVVMNGLGLDDWLLDLATAAGAGDVPVLALAEDLEDVAYLEAGQHGTDADASTVESAPVDDESGHDHGDLDPHLWLDASLAARYLERISAALQAVDPERAAAIAASTAAATKRLATLDTRILEALAALPQERRRVVTLHDAFGYFAAAYGLEVIDAVVANPGLEPSAADLARLIDTMRAEGVAAVLAESQFPDDLADMVAAEVGVPVVTGLYSDSLGDAPADTYEGMMRTNLELLLEALA